MQSVMLLLAGLTFCSSVAIADCCGWEVTQEGHLSNDNASGHVGIGFSGFFEPVSPLHVGGELTVDDRINVIGNLESDAFLQSDKLARSDGGFRLVLTNEDGEVVEIPMSPDLSAWFAHLYESDYLDQNNFDLGSHGSSGSEIPIYEDPFLWDPFCTGEHSPLSWANNAADNALIVDHCDENTNARVGINRSSVMSNTVLNVSGTSVFHDSEEASQWATVEVRADGADTKAFAVNQFGSGDGGWADPTMVVYGNGVIGARGIQVTDDDYTHDFPDYVFEPGYQLKSMKQYNDFIQSNGHLPGIPTAEEVKEQGYVDLGELQLSVLEKVEEQALYIMELHEEKQQAKRELKKIEQSVDKLEKRIQSLEADE